MENLTADNINDYVKKQDKVMVLFYAEWCPFSRAFLKIVNENLGKLKNKLATARVNEDENPLWDMFNVEIVPTLVAFKKGKIAARKDGIPQVGLSKEDLFDLDKKLA